MLSGRRDQQTVTTSGERVAQTIVGVVVRPATTQVDERGEVCEIFNPAWEISGAPLVYVYQAVVRPGKIKGWVYHEQQDDRLFVSLGFVKIVLFDLRENSPTRGRIDEVHLSERNRALLVIPRLVAHAVQNIGNTDALFINLPSRPYQHENPDKYRLALDSGAIPYDFASKPGW